MLCCAELQIVLTRVADADCPRAAARAGLHVVEALVYYQFCSITPETGTEVFNALAFLLGAPRHTELTAAAFRALGGLLRGVRVTCGGGVCNGQ